jgi:hypothetical protein
MATGLLLGGCDPISEPEGDPDDVPMSEIITLSRLEVGPLLTGGSDTDTFVARLPAGATSRVVTFKTTLGSFVLAGSKEMKVRAEAAGDSALIARAELRADTLTGTAIVSASVGDFTVYESVEIIRSPE